LVDIHPGAQIGEKFIIDHGTGIVIGETAVIGNNVLMYHGVTLGGTGNDSSNKRHPSICDNVMIAAGAKILGNIRVGVGAKVGANTVVLKDIPPYSTAVGMPARIIEGKKILDEECSLISKERK
jgi:serine O-acetyltransferase